MKRILPVSLLLQRASHAAARNNPATLTGVTGEWVVQRLANGTQVACSVLPNETAPVQLSALYRAGTRYENHSTESDESGICHFLRRAIGMSNQNCTGLATVRSFQQMGVSLDCVTSREHLTYNLSLSHPKYFEDAAALIGHSANSNHFYSWELSRVVYPYLRKDLDILYRNNFQQLLVELLHKAAYRNLPLSHSVYAPQYAITRGFTESSLRAFQSRCITPSRLTFVVTAGKKFSPNAEALMQKVQAIASGPAFTVQEASSSELLTDGKLSSTCGVACVGDARYSLPPLETAFVAVAWEGLPCGHKDQATLSVLLTALSGGKVQSPYVTWSYTPNGLLSKAIALGDRVTPSAAIAALSWSYSDSALVGFELSGTQNAVSSALPKALQEIKRVAREGLSESELKQAKKTAILDTLYALESPYKAAEHVGEELSLTGKHTPFSDILTHLENVSREDIKRVATSVLGENAPSCMAAVGDIDRIPYLSEL